MKTHAEWKRFRFVFQASIRRTRTLLMVGGRAGDLFGEASQGRTAALDRSRKELSVVHPFRAEVKIPPF